MEWGKIFLWKERTEIDGYSFKSLRKASSWFAWATKGHNGVPILTTKHALMWVSGSLKHHPGGSITDVNRKSVPKITLFTLAPIKLWVYVLHWPKFSSMLFCPYQQTTYDSQCKFTHFDFLSAAVTGRRKTCAILSPKKNVPVILLVA